jgi:hypothetical protein
MGLAIFAGLTGKPPADLLLLATFEVGTMKKRFSLHQIMDSRGNLQHKNLTSF